MKAKKALAELSNLEDNSNTLVILLKALISIHVPNISPD